MRFIEVAALAKDSVDGFVDSLHEAKVGINLVSWDGECEWFRFR